MKSDLSAVALLIGYRRIDLIERRLQELKLNMKIPVFVSIDGGLTESEIMKIKALLGKQQWDEEFNSFTYRILEKNFGLANHITSAITECLDQYDYVIVIEDDVVISRNFIASMMLGFEILRQSTDIYAVGGFSAYKNWMTLGLKNRWRKSKYFSAWGWGTSRSVWNKYQLHLPHNYRKLLQNSDAWNRLDRRKQFTWLGRFGKVDTINPKTWDFQMQFLMLMDDGQMLLPTSRISDNEGFNNKWSTHTTGDRPRWMLKMGTTSKVPKQAISKFSRLYEFGDSLTIGSDNWLFTGMTSFVLRPKSFLTFRR
jgi:hypothetical protein